MLDIFFCYGIYLGLIDFFYFVVHMIDKKDKKTNKHQKVWICDYLKRYETKKNSVSEYREKKLVSNFSYT